MKLDGAEQVGEQQPVDDEARACRGPRPGSCRGPRTAPARVRARRRGSRGPKTSSISSIRGTGLNTCRPTNRSGCPLATARSAIDSDEVVVARIVVGPPCGRPARPAAGPCAPDPRPPPRPGRSPAPARPDRSTTRTRSAQPFSSGSLSQCLATARRTRSADAAERAHSSTSPCGGGDGGEAARDRAGAGDGESFLQGISWFEGRRGPCPARGASRVRDCSVERSYPFRRRFYTPLTLGLRGF